MENNKYTRYNLRPIDKEEQKLFWKFREDDILDLFKYVCLVETIWLLAYISALFSEVTEKHMLAILLGVIACTMHWTVFCFRNRLKDKIVPITIALYTTYQILIGLFCEWIYRIDGVHDRTHIAIASNSMIVYCVFLTVSLSEAVYFGLIFILNVLINVLRNHDEQKRPFITHSAFVVVVILFMTYVFLRRELRRFF